MLCKQRIEAIIYLLSVYIVSLSLVIRESTPGAASVTQIVQGLGDQAVDFSFNLGMKGRLWIDFSKWVLRYNLHFQRSLRLFLVCDYSTVHINNGFPW